MTTLTELAEGLVSDRLSQVPGVASINLYGEQERIIRVRFLPLRLASRGLSVTDLRTALSSANLDSPLGALETENQSMIVRSVASAVTAEQIAAIQINRDTVVGDVALVQETAKERTSITRVNGQPAVGPGVIRQSVGNTLSISLAIRDAVAELQPSLPGGVNLNIASDDGVYIERSISGVTTSILLAVAIVILVIALFLRSFRAVLIPAVTVPIALVGTIAAIWLAGFSINTITLLALVLATGMVVDDAIVVLENIVRKRRDGLGPFAAAAVGTREVFFAVISTTATLAAVFIPISFLPGQAGGIFSEFGFVLAFSVALSSFVALTLCPTLCSLFDPGATAAGSFSDDSQSSSWFDRIIDIVLKWRLALVVLSIAFAVVAIGLYNTLPKELTPSEDRALIIVSVRTPASASLEYTGAQVEEIEQTLQPLLDSGEITAVQSLVGRGSVNQALMFVRLAAWEDRQRTQEEIISSIREPLNQIPGAQISLRVSNSLGIRGAGNGLQFAVVGNDYDQLDTLAGQLVEKMSDDPTFVNPQLSYDPNQPQLELQIDRALAANLGISPREVLDTLNTMIEGETTVEVFQADQSTEVWIIPGGPSVNDPTDLESVFIEVAEGDFMPASAIMSLQETAASATLARESRQRAVSGRTNMGE